MIDYNLLNKAIDFYSEKGYQRIEVPWMVTEEVDSITRPKDVKPFVVNEKNKNLIASGEQGFLYLMMKGQLPPGKYQTLTPCFRNDIHDFEHSKQFMKIELINTISIVEGISEIMSASLEFFETIFDLKDLKFILNGNTEYDINFKDIELGSYGYRKYKHLEWIYGTGLAEPRTSRIIKQI